MNCICGEEIDGSLVMVDPNIEPSHVPVCPICFNLWANQEWEELTKRVSEGLKKSNYERAQDDKRNMGV